MKQQLGMLLPNITSTSLAYELNAVALAFAAEVERMVTCDYVSAADATICGTDFVPELQQMINTLHEATLALRYFRHNGEMPPPRG